MIIAVTPMGGRTFQMDWPGDWRIPARGELLMHETGDYAIDNVQWEIVDTAGPVVHLRVIPC